MGLPHVPGRHGAAAGARRRRARAGVLPVPGRLCHGHGERAAQWTRRRVAAGPGRRSSTTTLETGSGARAPPLVHRRPTARPQADGHVLHRLLRPRPLPRVRLRATFLTRFELRRGARRGAAQPTTRRCSASPSAGCASPCSREPTMTVRGGAPSPRRQPMSATQPLSGASPGAGPRPQSPDQPLLVVGAGIAGITAALEAAEAGPRGGAGREGARRRRPRRSADHQYFPKLCPPSCGMEINIRRLEQNPRVRVLTRHARSRALRGAPRRAGRSPSRTRPPYVTDRLHGLRRVRARSARRRSTTRSTSAWARSRRSGCPTPTPGRAATCSTAPACPAGLPRLRRRLHVQGAIDLDAKSRARSVEVGAVVVATGWNALPARRSSPSSAAACCPT